MSKSRLTHSFNPIKTVLLIANTFIVVAIIIQHRGEAMRHMTNDIFTMQPFDVTVFAQLWAGANTHALSYVLLKSASRCLINVEKDNLADHHREYLTKKLLPLRDAEGFLVFNHRVPAAVNW